MMAWYAALSPIHALNHLQKNKKLYLAILGPMITSIAILVAVFWLLSGWVHSTQQWMTPLLSVPDWLATALEWIIKLLALALLSILTVPLAALCSFPFTDWISRSVLPSQSLPLPFSFQLKLAIQEAARSLLALLIVIGGIVGGLLANAIPGGILISPLIATLAGASSLAIQFLTYPLALQGYSVRNSLRWLIQNWPITLAFGLVHTLLFSIPLLLPIMIPMATLAGALIHAKLLTKP